MDKVYVARKISTVKKERRVCFLEQHFYNSINLERKKGLKSNAKMTFKRVERVE